MGLSGYAWTALFCCLISGQQSSPREFYKRDIGSAVDNFVSLKIESFGRNGLYVVDGTDFGDCPRIWRAAYREHVSRVKCQPEGKSVGQLVDFYSVGAEPHRDCFAGHNTSQREERSFGLPHVLSKIRLSQVDRADPRRRKVKAAEIGNVGCRQAADVRQGAVEGFNRQTRAVSFEPYAWGHGPAEPRPLLCDENLACEGVGHVAGSNRSLHIAGLLVRVVANDLQLPLASVPKPVSASFQSPREIGNESGGDCRNDCGRNIEPTSEVPDDDVDNIVRGATFFAAILIGLAYLVVRLGVRR